MPKWLSIIVETRDCKNNRNSKKKPIKKLFYKPKKRLATKPTRSSILNKKKTKKVIKEKKINRKKPEF